MQDTQCQTFAVLEFVNYHGCIPLKLPLVIVGIYLMMSLIAFIAYAIDKSAAQNDRWRIQESTLHLISLMGGWSAAYIAQKKLRHKSSKKEFINVYRATGLLNLGGLFWLHTEKGGSFINNLVFHYSMANQLIKLGEPLIHEPTLGEKSEKVCKDIIWLVTHTDLVFLHYADTT